MPVTDEPEPPNFCRVARVEVFDGQYQVLRHYSYYVRDIDTTNIYRLDAIARFYAGQARALENEPMKTPRVVLICTHVHRKIVDHVLVRSE